ncbi:DUF3951 domain-containing protein [Bacillus luteolus]|uniref:DUF3951 domain-containing protein n=1 Tax=Litchfieldia luteola TaxID=682179 RepID=A0ABR9QMX0_9BACI|nr:DUF3951 domain-containing protein [Cytobacillus luteolus]MBE4909855.1 DUF3951 domain-containing protein [Cytobacillus luteolus]MBP1942596.1 hypothetical protein [Cytobacillus luteolus]
MAYVYTLFVISVIGFVMYRMMKKKVTPSNRYTPFDTITTGNKVDAKQHDSLVEDNKQNSYKLKK